MKWIAYAVIHWAARGAALLVVGAFLVLLAGELLNPHSVPLTQFRDWVGLVLVAAAIIGMLVAWKWELPGALLSLLSLAAFVPVVRMRRYDIVGFAAIPDILYLIDCLLRHNRPVGVLR